MEQPEATTTTIIITKIKRDLPHQKVHSRNWHQQDPDTLSEMNSDDDHVKYSGERGGVSACMQECVVIYIERGVGIYFIVFIYKVTSPVSCPCNGIV